MPSTFIRRRVPVPGLYWSIPVSIDDWVKKSSLAPCTAFTWQRIFFLENGISLNALFVNGDGSFHGSLEEPD